MASSTTTRRGPSGLRRRRPPKRTYKQLMEKLIGKKAVGELLKTGHCKIKVRDAEFGLHLVDAAIYGSRHYCINPYPRGDGNAMEVQERCLSKLYPKVALLLTDYNKFMRTAG